MRGDVGKIGKFIFPSLTQEIFDNFSLLVHSEHRINISLGVSQHRFWNCVLTRKPQQYFTLRVCAKTTKKPPLKDLKWLYLHLDFLKLDEKRQREYSRIVSPKKSRTYTICFLFINLSRFKIASGHNVSQGPMLKLPFFLSSCLTNNFGTCALYLLV